MITIFNLFRTGTPVGIAANGIPGWMPYGNGDFPGSKDGKGIDGLDLKDIILKWYEYPGIFTDMAENIRKDLTNAVAGKPEFTIRPATGDCVPVQDYPQLGSTAALVLGLDSVTGRNIVRTMNAVNALIGKPLITKEVINYNKKSTDNFAERYKMAQVIGVGAMIYTAVAGATEAAIMEVFLESSKYLDLPETKNGTLNIGAGSKPVEGAYNIDLNPQVSGVHLGDATNLSNVLTGSQSKIIMENPYGYNPLNSEVYRVLESGGTIEISGGMSNKFFNKIYKMTDAELQVAGYSVVSKGAASGAATAYTTAGEPIKSTIMEIVLRKK